MKNMAGHVTESRRRTGTVTTAASLLIDVVRLPARCRRQVVCKAGSADMVRGVRRAAQRAL